MKICIKCNINKNDDDFIFRKDNNKLRNECKECYKIIKHQYYLKNKDEIKMRTRKYALENSDQTKEYKKQHYENNKKQIIERAAKWTENNKEKVAVSRKKYKMNNRDKLNKQGKEYYIKIAKNRRIKKSYGIDKNQVENMLLMQNNKCAICMKNFGDLYINRFHIDHNHKNNKVRGLLCSNCNLGIGFFKEDKEFLSKAIEYLNLYNIGK